MEGPAAAVGGTGDAGAAAGGDGGGAEAPPGMPSSPRAAQRWGRARVKLLAGFVLKNKARDAAKGAGSPRAAASPGSPRRRGGPGRGVVAEPGQAPSIDAVVWELRRHLDDLAPAAVTAAAHALAQVAAQAAAADAGAGATAVWAACGQRASDTLKTRRDEEKRTEMTQNMADELVLCDRLLDKKDKETNMLMRNWEVTKRRMCDKIEKMQGQLLEAEMKVQRSEKMVQEVVEAAPKIIVVHDATQARKTKQGDTGFMGHRELAEEVESLRVKLQVQKSMNAEYRKREKEKEKDLKRAEADEKMRLHFIIKGQEFIMALQMLKDTSREIGQLISSTFSAMQEECLSTVRAVLKDTDKNVAIGPHRAAQVAAVTQKLRIRTEALFRQSGMDKVERFKPGLPDVSPEASPVQGPQPMHPAEGERAPQYVMQFLSATGALEELSESLEMVQQFGVGSQGIAQAQIKELEEYAAQCELACKELREKAEAAVQEKQYVEGCLKVLKEEKAGLERRVGEEREAGEQRLAKQRRAHDAAVAQMRHEFAEERAGLERELAGADAGRRERELRAAVAAAEAAESLRRGAAASSEQEARGEVAGAACAELRAQLATAVEAAGCGSAEAAQLLAEAERRAKQLLEAREESCALRAAVQERDDELAAAAALREAADAAAREAREAADRAQRALAAAEQAGAQRAAQLTELAGSATRRVAELERTVDELRARLGDEDSGKVFRKTMDQLEDRMQRAGLTAEEQLEATRILRETRALASEGTKANWKAMVAHLAQQRAKKRELGQREERANLPTPPPAPEGNSAYPREAHERANCRCHQCGKGPFKRELGQMRCTDCGSHLYYGVGNSPVLWKQQTVRWFQRRQELLARRGLLIQRMTDLVEKAEKRQQEEQQRPQEPAPPVLSPQLCRTTVLDLHAPAYPRGQFRLPGKRGAGDVQQQPKPDLARTAATPNWRAASELCPSPQMPAAAATPSWSSAGIGDRGKGPGAVRLPPTLRGGRAHPAFALPPPALPESRRRRAAANANGSPPAQAGTPACAPQHWSSPRCEAEGSDSDGDGASPAADEQAAQVMNRKLEEAAEAMRAMRDRAQQRRDGAAARRRAQTDASQPSGELCGGPDRSPPRQRDGLQLPRRLPRLTSPGNGTRPPSSSTDAFSSGGGGPASPGSLSPF